jgi:hypothetical protein
MLMSMLCASPTHGHGVAHTHGMSWRKTMTCSWHGLGHGGRHGKTFAVAHALGLIYIPVQILMNEKPIFMFMP